MPGEPLMVADETSGAGIRDAGSVNLLGATTLYAFKFGWDMRSAKSSPGALHQHLLLSLVCCELPDVTCLDSCARRGTLLEDLWPHWIDIGEAVLPKTRIAHSAVAALSSASRLKSLKGRCLWLDRRVKNRVVFFRNQVVCYEAVSPHVVGRCDSYRETGAGNQRSHDDRVPARGSISTTDKMKDQSEHQDNLGDRNLNCQHTGCRLLQVADADKGCDNH